MKKGKLSRVFDRAGFEADVNLWAEKYQLRVIIFNLVVIFLFLLHSVGYFYPFVPITINFIVIIIFCLSTFLLGAGSKSFFVIALLFWLITGFFKLVQINVWAERSAIYVYQSLIFGAIMLFIEIFKGDRD